MIQNVGHDGPLAPGPWPDPAAGLVRSRSRNFRNGASVYKSSIPHATKCAGQQWRGPWPSCLACMASRERLVGNCVRQDSLILQGCLLMLFSFKSSNWALNSGLQLAGAACICAENHYTRLLLVSSLATSIPAARSFSCRRNGWRT